MNALPTYTCKRAARPPRLDGGAGDPEWARAEAVALVRTQTGEPPRYATEARMLWDDECLYVAFVCEDPDIWGTILEQDGDLYKEEVVELFIDHDCDGAEYFEFEVSPHNITLDLLITWRDGRMQGDRVWHCEGWRTAVQVEGTLDDRTDTDTRWSAEMAIPWAGLGIAPPRAGERMRMNLYRIDRARDGDEFSAWSPTLSPSYHVPARFGDVVFG